MPAGVLPLISGKTVLAIIPARKGSRRCPNKNLTPFLGIPLIQLAIYHATSCREIDTICISSDSDEILKFAIPPIIPLRRPDHLATDYATSEAVIAHALYSLSTFGEHVIPPHDLFVLLQPTSPFRIAADITSCLRLAVHHGSSLSVRPGGKRNGAVYACSTTRFLSTLSLATPSPIASHTMSDFRSHDIDLPEDFNVTPPLA